MKISEWKNHLTKLALLTAALLQGNSASAVALLDLNYMHGSQLYPLGVSESGRATGYDYDGTLYYCFRTGVQEALQPFHQIAGQCIQHYLNDNIYPTVVSVGNDIHQSGSNPIRLVGAFIPTNSHWRAFWYYEDLGGYYNPGGKWVQALTEPSGAGESSAFAVVPTGPGGASDVVGYAGVNGKLHACRWYVSTNSQTLYDLGATYLPTNYNSVATGTDYSRVVGYYNSGYNTNTAFILDGNTFYDLHKGSATSTEALGINNNKLIVGSRLQNGYTQPVFWHYGTSGVSTSIVLSTSTYSHGIARGVNNAGYIVGSVWNTTYPNVNYDEVACYWTTNGGPVTLNSVSGGAAVNMIRAYKINSSSALHIVGVMTNPGGSNARGFLFYGWD